MIQERQIRLIELVSEQKKMEVSRLAKLLETSEVTIRKDLDYLSEKGILKRERGYALLNDADSIQYRMAFQYQIKQRIAEEAVSLVKDGETVMIESGSTCTLLAEMLAKKRRDVTIVTNSAYLASYVRESRGLRIVVLGGDYQPQAQAMVGPLTKLCAAQYRVDKIFVGTDGFSYEGGFTGDNLIRSDTVRAMAESAERVIVLAESEKFSRTGTVSFLKVQEVSDLITDEWIPRETAAYLETAGVTVRAVPRELSK